MTGPGVLADTGRFVVSEDGPRVLVIDRGRGPSELTTVALVLITLVCGVSGVVSLFYAATRTTAGSSAVVGTGLLVVSLLAGAAMLIAARSLRATRLTPLEDLPPVAVFDRERRVFLDGDGEMVAPLTDVCFRRRGSITPDLVATTPAGDRVLLHGSLFSGAVHNLDEVLTAAVGSERA
jgi:hypothetical protein